MMFALFSVGIATGILCQYSDVAELRTKAGLRRLRQEGADSMAALRSAEGAVFALVGCRMVFRCGEAKSSGLAPNGTRSSNSCRRDGGGLFRSQL